MQWTLEELLPHRPPMILLDAVESFDPEKGALRARVDISPRQIFFDAALGGVPNWVAAEFMAQAAAACAGAYDRSQAPDKPARPGLLLGMRRLALDLPFFADGKSYAVTAAQAFHDDDAAAFECAMIDDAGRTVATAVLNAYRPPDFASFLKSNA